MLHPPNIALRGKSEKWIGTSSRFTITYYLFAESKNGTPEGTRTPDLLLRRQLLYPAELQAHINQEDRLIFKTGAGDGNRTHVFSLEG